jgi:hypothetical protein
MSAPSPNSIIIVVLCATFVSFVALWGKISNWLLTPELTNATTNAQSSQRTHKEDLRILNF